MTNWPKVKLGDVAPVQAARPSSSNRVWLLNLDAIEPNTGAVLDYCCQDVAKLGGSTVWFDADNVLYSKLRPYLNKVVLPTETGCGTSELLPLRPDKSRLSRNYLAYFLRSKNFVGLISEKVAGAKMPRVVVKDFKNALIPLPPLAEQAKIVAILDAVSATLQKRRNQLDELDALVRARFVEMFGDPITNDRRWQTRPLGALCDISRGGSPRPIQDYLGGNIPWIKIGDATSGDDFYLRSTKEHIVESGVSKSRFIKKGSLIFANSGVSLGFARIVSFDGCIHDGWLALEDIDVSLNKGFLLKTLNFCTEYFRRTAPEGTQPNLNVSIMKQFIQIVPPIELQANFVRFVRSVERAKEAVRSGIAETRTFFDALTAEYFG